MKGRRSPLAEPERAVGRSGPRDEPSASACSAKAIKASRVLGNWRRISLHTFGFRPLLYKENASDGDKSSNTNVTSRNKAVYAWTLPVCFRSYSLDLARSFSGMGVKTSLRQLANAVQVTSLPSVGLPRGSVVDTI